MRDCLKNRTGYDRVLMAVAATFLTVSATSAFAQADAIRKSPADLAIDAAIPRPEPANLPPPTVNDFKLDTTGSTPDVAKMTDKTTDTKSSNVVAAPSADTKAPDAAKSDTATVTPASPPATVAATPPPSLQRSRSRPPATSRRRISRSPTGCATCSVRNHCATSTARPNEARSRSSTRAREFAPVWTQGGTVTESGKGVIARLKDAASEGLNASDYPVPDFAAATTPDQLAEADLKLTASMLDYARQAQSGRMHWSQVSGDILYPEHPTDPTEVLDQHHDRHGCLRGARRLQPAAQALP